MNIKNYDVFISRTSQKFAEELVSQEANLVQQALFLCADIDEVTRQIGLQTAQRIYEQVVAPSCRREETID